MREYCPWLRRSLRNPLRLRRGGSQITDDAIWMPQNQEEIHGKDKIFQWAVWFFSTYRYLPDKGEPKHEKSVIKEDIAYHRFTSKGVYIVIETGDTIPYNQKYLDIMKKINGQWKIACHMWSSNNSDESIWNRKINN